MDAKRYRECRSAAFFLKSIGWFFVVVVFGAMALAFIAIGRGEGESMGWALAIMPGGFVALALISGGSALGKLTDEVHALGVRADQSEGLPEPVDSGWDPKWHEQPIWRVGLAVLVIVGFAFGRGLLGHEAPDGDLLWMTVAAVVGASIATVFVVRQQKRMARDWSDPSRLRD